jgi:hypothetical protein
MDAKNADQKPPRNLPNKAVPAILWAMFSLFCRANFRDTHLGTIIRAVNGFQFISRARSMMAEFYLTSVDRRWKKELKRASGKVIILSPYLSSRTAELVIECVPSVRCEIYTRFSVEDFANGSSSLRTLKHLLSAHYCLYEIDRLHAKVILASGRFATIGSQNLTANGVKNREATALFSAPEEVNRLEGLIGTWLNGRRAITIEMVADLMERIAPAARRFKAAKKAAEELEEEVWQRERVREQEAKFTQLRRRLQIQRARQSLSELLPGGAVPEHIARDFLRASTCWHFHPRSHRIEPASGFADHMYGPDGDWRIRLNNNPFLVGKAIEGCRKGLEEFLADAEAGKLWHRAVVAQNLRRIVQGAVEDGNSGNPYQGDYPLENDGHMVFGNHSINVSAFVNEMLRRIPQDFLYLPDPGDIRS